MRRFYEGNDNKGYQEVVDKAAGLELIGFDLIRHAVLRLMMSHLTSLVQEEACLTASQRLFMFQEILSMKLQQPEA